MQRAPSTVKKSQTSLPNIRSLPRGLRSVRNRPTLRAKKSPLVHRPAENSRRPYEPGRLITYNLLRVIQANPAISSITRGQPCFSLYFTRNDGRGREYFGRVLDPLLADLNSFSSVSSICVRHDLLASFFRYRVAYRDRRFCTCSVCHIRKHRRNR